MNLVYPGYLLFSFNITLLMFLKGCYSVILIFVLSRHQWVWEGERRGGGGGGGVGRGAWSVCSLANYSVAYESKRVSYSRDFIYVFFFVSNGNPF